MIGHKISTSQIESLLFPFVLLQSSSPSVRVCTVTCSCSSGLVCIYTKFNESRSKKRIGTRNHLNPSLRLQCSNFADIFVAVQSSRCTRLYLSWAQQKQQQQHHRFEETWPRIASHRVNISFLCKCRSGSAGESLCTFDLTHTGYKNKFRVGST